MEQIRSSYAGIHKNAFWFILAILLTTCFVIDLTAAIYRTAYFSSRTDPFDLKDVINIEEIKDLISTFRLQSQLLILSSCLKYAAFMLLFTFGGVLFFWRRFRSETKKEFPEEVSDSFYKRFECYRALLLIPLLHIADMICGQWEFMNSVIAGLLGMVINLVLIKIWKKYSLKNKTFMVIIPAIIYFTNLFVGILLPSLILLTSTPMPSSTKGYSECMEALEKAGFPKNRVYTFSTLPTPMAFQTGFGPLSLMVVSTKALEILTPMEAAAVLSHEAGHWSYSHVAYIGVFFALVPALQVFFLYYFYSQKSLHRAFGFIEGQVPSGIALLITAIFCRYLFKPIKWLTNMITFVIEYQADAFAATQGYGIPLINALFKLHRFYKHLPPNFLLFFFEDHPSFGARAAAIRKVCSLVIKT